MRHGLYLCKVRGLKYLDYAVLKYDEYGWWQYIKEYTGENVEGWCGCSLEVVKVIELIKEN